MACTCSTNHGQPCAVCGSSTQPASPVTPPASVLPRAAGVDVPMRTSTPLNTRPADDQTGVISIGSHQGASTSTILPSSGIRIGIAGLVLPQAGTRIPQAEHWCGNRNRLPALQLAE